MRFSLAITLLATLEVASGFVPNKFGSVQQKHASIELNMVDKKDMLPTSPEEIARRARKASGLPEYEDAPKLYEDDILDDFQESLLKLEKRVKEGPGSLSASEIDELEAATGRIVTEMKEKLAEEASSPPKGASSSATTAAAPNQLGSPPQGASSPVTSSAPVETAPPSPVAEAKTSPPNEKKASEPVTSSPPNPTNPVVNKAKDANLDEEGPAYDGSGGMGQPRGTRNTYVIPGMDAMSPEEYREALQESVIGAQRKRRQQYGGMVGNRASHSYLNQLGWGGATENLAGNAKEGASDVTDSFDFDSYQLTDEQLAAKPAPAPAPKPAAVAPPPPAPKPAAVAPPAPAPKPAAVVAPPPPAAETTLSTIANKHNPVPESFEQVEFNKAHDVVDKVTDVPLNEDGPAYDGSGGMGQPRGTRNTYVIPGMDAMSPEEYREALQESVIGAQRKRRQQYGGMVGNRASHSYLNQLGWGGATENLAGSAKEGASDVTESFDFDGYQTKKSDDKKDTKA